MEERQASSRQRIAARIADVAQTGRTGLPMPSHNGVIRRALVAEAEPEALQLCRDVLEKSGFVVDAVDSGIAAVIAARDQCPDLIFVDLQLRDVPGREAITWLRSNPALRSTPIIVLMMNTDDDLDQAAIQPGAALRKPVSPAAIQRTIREVLK
jgi:two-component system, OmpR family, response regulator